MHFKSAFVIIKLIKKQGELFMKLKKLLSVFVLGLALFALAACGRKSPEDIAKNVLKESYTGHSQEDSYEHDPFVHGGSTLIFDKEKHLIKNSEEEILFAVLSEEQVKKIPSSYVGTLKGLETQLRGTDNFTIAVGDNATSKPEEAEAYYQVVLSDGGKKIRVIELRRGYKDEDAFYDFTGQAD